MMTKKSVTTATNPPEHACAVVKALLQELRDSERVAGSDGVAPQPPREEGPGEHSAQEDAACPPRRRAAALEGQRRHDKHRTTAHRRGAGAQCGREGVQLAAAQHVVPHRSHLARPHNGNADQNSEVDAEDGEDPNVQECHRLMWLRAQGCPIPRVAAVTAAVRGRRTPPGGDAAPPRSPPAAPP